MMRNFTYKIVVAIVVFISYAVGSNAQTPVPTVLINLPEQPKNDFELVLTTDNEATVYHAVSGTSVEFTLDNYDSNCIYSYGRNDETERKNLDVESDGKFTLILTNDTQDNSVRYTYKFYASNDDDTSSQYSIDFVVYKEPKIEDIKLIPSQKYHILGSGNDVNVQLEYTPSIYWGEHVNFIKVDWLLGSDIITSTSNQYILPNDISFGRKDFSVTIKALAPDKSTEWLKKTITTSIQVYATPSVKLTPASPYAIVGGNAIDVNVDLTETDEELQGGEGRPIQIKTSETWSGAAKKDDSELSAQFVATAENLGSQTISTTVEWYYMDGVNEIPLYNKTLTENNGAASIMVYATPSVKLTPVSPYAIVGGAEIDVKLDFTGETDSDLKGENSRIKIETDKWSGAVKADNELSASFNPSADGINTGQENYITTEVTWYYEDEGSNKKINLYTKELKDIENGAASIMVYATPSVKLTPVSPYAIVDGAKIDVDVDLSGTPDQLKGGGDIKIKTSETWSGAAKNDDSELSAQFTAKAENLDTQTISTTVEWYYMDGNNEIPLYNKTLTENNGAASIMVYAAPSVKLTPVSPYAIVDGAKIDVDVDLSGTPDQLKGGGDIKIKTSETWSGAAKNDDSELSAQFTAKAENLDTQTISTTVEWYYMDDSNNEIPLYTYGEDEELSATITVYAEPTYNLDTDDIYNSFVDVEIPTDCFVDPSDKIKNNTEIISNIYLMVGDAICDGPLKPKTTVDNKQISLNVQYKHGETILYDKQTDYTINIIEKPNWRTNFQEIFGTNANGEADNYLYTTSDLLYESTNAIEVQQSNANENDEWIAQYSINGSTSIDFSTDSGNLPLKSVALSDLLSSLKDGENTIKFSFSYEVQNLLGLEDNTKLKCKNDTAYIYLCEKIDASLPDNFPCEFYTRVGDGKINDLKTDQISLTVVGGDPGLWKFELQDDKKKNVLLDDDVVYDENGGVKINIDYGRLNFSERCTKNYTLYAKYVDGITVLGTDTSISEITINVEPEPELDDLVVGLLGDKGVTYNPVNENDYDIKCYKGDKIKLSSSSNTSSTSYTSSWKYKVGKTAKDITWGDNISFESEDAIGTIEFYSYLKDNSKERLVKTINLQVEYLSTPSVGFNHKLLDLINQDTANSLWNDATDKNRRLDLYAGWEENLTIDVEPQNGYEDGWTYEWKLDEDVVSNNKNFDYKLHDPSDGSEDKVISFTYKNSIPASDYQDGENVGLEETKSYYVRVWRKAEMPTKIDDISLKDNQNVNNKVNETMAIREGNDLELSFPKIKYCFVPNNKGDVNTYVLKDDKGNSNSIIGVDNTTPRLTHTIKSIENEETDSEFGFGKNKYKLVISNLGPRDIPWEKYEIPVEITVYNRPKTPSSLIRKGNGNSGTLIITYDDGEGNVLPVPEDYSIVFRYNKDGNIKEQESIANDKRWITTDLKLTDDMMEEAYAFSRFNYPKDNGGEQNVRITSGRIIAGDIDESWDESEYNLTDEQMAEARARTRAGGGDYTAIQSVESEKEMVSVYNTSGVKVATSTENLKPGIYIIRSMQNGEMNSKKLSVK